MFYEALNFLGAETMAWLTFVVLLAGAARLPIFGDPFAITLLVAVVVVSGLYGIGLSGLALAAPAVLWLALTPSLSRPMDGWRGRVSGRLAAAGVVAGTAALWGALPDIAAGWIIGLQVFTVLAAGSTVRVTTALGTRQTSWFMTLSALGIFVGPPDTELTATLAAFLLVAVVGGPLWRAIADPAVLQAAAFTVVLLWAALHGSVGRLAAFPGAVGCLGVLVVGPLLDPALRGSTPPRTTGLVIRLAFHAINVMVCGRIAALQRDVRVSVVITSLSWLALGAALRVTARCERSVKAAVPGPGNPVPLRQFLGKASWASARFR